MKISLFRPFIFLLLCVSAVSAQQNRQIQEAVTHEQLVAKLRQEQANDPLRHLSKVEGKDPSKENQPQDLLSRSDILCYNGIATLVPKQAIIAIPPQLADRIGIQPGAKIVGWNEFFAANRGWLTAQEVTLTQARGQEPLADALRERLTKSANIVVATLQGGPISKLQYTPPQSPPTN